MVFKSKERKLEERLKEFRELRELAKKTLTKERKSNPPEISEFMAFLISRDATDKLSNIMAIASVILILTIAILVRVAQL